MAIWKFPYGFPYYIIYSDIMNIQYYDYYRSTFFLVHISIYPLKNHMENDRNRASVSAARSDSHAALAAELPKSTVATTGRSWVEEEMEGRMVNIYIYIAIK